MIYELLATALLACSMGAGNYKDEPKRVVIPNVFGEYSITINYSNGSIKSSVDGPNGGATREDNNFGTDGIEFTLVTNNGLMSTTFKWTQENNYAVKHCEGITIFRFNGLAEEKRFTESYFQMQEDGTYSADNGFDISELTNEAEPEIYWSCVFTGFDGYYGQMKFNLPFMYMVDLETFGVQESSRVSYMKAGTQYQQTFNAIYEDKTEPKLYAFWIDKYMLARQIRLNGDIINQNYVTAMDGIDPSFGKQVRVTFTPSDDVYLKVSATPYDPSWELVNDYNRGYTDGKAEGEKPVSWFKNIFDGMASFFSVEIIPHLSLGLIMFAPLLVLAIIVIVRIFKHGG